MKRQGKRTRKISEERWDQLLEWVYAKIPRTSVWPYTPDDLILCNAPWEPRTEQEKDEAAILESILTTKHFWELEKALTQVKQTLAQAFHLTKNEAENAWRKHLSGEYDPNIIRPVVICVNSRRHFCYVWKRALLERDKVAGAYEGRAHQNLVTNAPDGGRATAKYTDNEIVAAFKAYKKYCGSVVPTLSRAIERLIDRRHENKEEAKAFYLQKITTPGALWDRLRKTKHHQGIAHPLSPSLWWKSL